MLNFNWGIFFTRDKSTDEIQILIVLVHRFSARIFTGMTKEQIYR